jgi:hypothetical protein
MFSSDFIPSKGRNFHGKTIKNGQKQEYTNFFRDVGTTSKF